MGKHVGALARLEGLKTLRALDEKLASIKGLDVDELAVELNLHRRTVARYLRDVCELGVPVEKRGRRYFYSENEFELFSYHADRCLI